MSEPAGAECRSDVGHCITCGDEGTAVRVLELAEETARCVDEHGAIHAVAVDLVGAVQPGDQLLVHAGVALTRLQGAGSAPCQARTEPEHPHHNTEMDAPRRWPV